MILKAKIEVLSPYRGKSKFNFWKELVVGDIIEGETAVADPGRNYSQQGLYATGISLRKYSEGDPLKVSVFSCSLTECANYLKQVEHKEL